MVRDFKAKISFSPWVCVWCAILLLTVPLRWVGAWLIAVACHECCHILALMLFRKRIHGIYIGNFGAEIRSEFLQPAEAIICALAGPMAGVILMLFARTYPRLALCGFLQTVFNLLPILPLDGGVALSGFLRMFWPPKTVDKISNMLENGLLLLLLFGTLLGTLIWKLGVIPLLVGTALFLRLKKRKIPCKWSLYRVQ